MSKSAYTKGEVAALITVLATGLMVVGSLIGMRASKSITSSTTSFASCTFHPKSFVKVVVNDQILPLTSSIEPKITDMAVWSTKNDRSQTTRLKLNSNGEAEGIVVDTEYCCGDRGFNTAVNWPGRTYKMSSGDKASVTLTSQDARYSVVKKCPYDAINPSDPRCYDVPLSDPDPKTISDLPIDCLSYSYGWVMKCEGSGCPSSAQPTNQPEQPTPTVMATTTPPPIFNECKVHFIIDNSSSINEFANGNKEAIEQQIQNYRQLPGHQNDAVKVNYQYFNKDVSPASAYVDTKDFVINLVRENWTNIDAALRQAVEPSTSTTKIVNFLFTDGKPTVLNVDVAGQTKQCTGSYENRDLTGCTPCLISDKANCKYPYVLPFNSCPANIKQKCQSLNYNRDFVDVLKNTKWVDYSISMGDTPFNDLLNGVSKNGVIPVTELASKIGSIIERECGIPAPTPGKERSRSVRGDVNGDGIVSTLDVVACFRALNLAKCDLIADGRLNSLDRSEQIGLLGQRSR